MRFFNIFFILFAFNWEKKGKLPPRGQFQDLILLKNMDAGMFSKTSSDSARFYPNYLP